MQTFVQNHLGLVIVSAIMVLATLLLAFVSTQMRAAGFSLKPIAFVAVFFALVLVPQFFGHLATAVWPKPQTLINDQAFAGDTGFEHPEYLFGPGTSASDLRDAKPIFPEMLSRAEIAQLLLRGTGEMTLGARFASAADADESSTKFWTSFSLTGTSGSEEQGWWGTRRPAGDVMHMKRIDNTLAIWLGPNKGSIRERLADVRLTTAPQDLRPLWIRVFDRALVKVLMVLLLVALASWWFFKGSSWAARIDGEGSAVSAAELSQRLSQLANKESFQSVGGNVWELIIRYDTTGEVGRYRYLLRLDPDTHRVLVTEFVSSRVSPSGNYNWRKEWGITFFRKGAGIDLQSHKGPIIQAVTSAGWDWQPVLFDLPSASK